MLIFNNHFFYYLVCLNIMMGCYYDIHNIRYLKYRYVDDLFKHKNHIYGYILFRCYFNGGFIGFCLSHLVYMFNVINIKHIDVFFTIFITLSHITYLSGSYIENKKISYKDILAIYGFHTGFINLICR